MAVAAKNVDRWFLVSSLARSPNETRFEMKMSRAPLTGGWKVLLPKIKENRRGANFVGKLIR